jgi:hypothetical protein
MKFNIEYSTNSFDAGSQFAGQNAFLFLQAGSIQVESVNEMNWVCHISSTLKGLVKDLKRPIRQKTS